MGKHGARKLASQKTTKGPEPIDTEHPEAYRAALDFLFGRIDYERTSAVPYGRRDFKLDRMKRLLDLLGNPQQQQKILHVAGTKGKGSTAAMLSAVLTAAGYRVGKFTSPHLDRVEERMAVDSLACTPQEFTELIDQVRPLVEQMDAEAAREEPSECDALQNAQAPNGPTYFEITTAMALLHFARRQVDATVLEVGLGGRLDSTNVCQPVVSVITSISLDHTKQLGGTLASIAREKAGIIKPNVPVVSGVLDPEPRNVIQQIASGQGCRLVQLGVDFLFRYTPPQAIDRIDLDDHLDDHLDDEDTPSKTDNTQFIQRGRIQYDDFTASRPVRLSDLTLGLLGDHQGANAAVALATLEQLRQQGWNIPEEALRQGLATAQCPARVELISRRPAIVIDAAHNLASTRALLRVLQESFTSPRRLLIFASTRDKDIRGMLGELLPRFDHVIFTRYLNNPRAVSPEELDEIAGQLSDIPRTVRADPASAWDHVGSIATPDHLVCVTGSFFIAAELRKLAASEPWVFPGCSAADKAAV